MIALETDRGFQSNSRMCCVPPTLRGEVFSKAQDETETAFITSCGSKVNLSIEHRNRAHLTFSVTLAHSRALALDVCPISTFRPRMTLRVPTLGYAMPTFSHSNHPSRPLNARSQNIQDNVSFRKPRTASDKIRRARRRAKLGMFPISFWCRFGLARGIHLPQTFAVAGAGVRDEATF